MTKLFLAMPQPGETITEGTIVEWVKKVGDFIAEGEAVCELETEKAVFEYESPFEGTLVEILESNEAKVQVSKPIAIMEVEESKAKNYLMLGIADVADDSVIEKNKITDSAETAIVETVKESEKQNLEIDVSHLKMAPYVRKLAYENSIGQKDLEALAKNHPEARVTKSALLDFIEKGNLPQKSKTQFSSSKPQKSGKLTYQKMPFSPIRMRIAENMMMSKQNIPHAHTGLSVDVTELVKTRESLKGEFEKKYKQKLNYLTLLQKPLLSSIQKFPQLNSSFVTENEKSEIRIFDQINLGVAVGSDNGLIIPVVHESEKLNAVEFNGIITDKISKANKKKLMPDDFANPTIVFNNFGFFGIRYGVQIIQYPLCCTIGMGAIEDKVVPFGEGIAIRKIADFFISFDHRILDGKEAGLFLSHLKKSVENLSFEIL